MTFEINSTPLTFIAAAQWNDLNLTSKVDGQVLINNYQRHTWGTNVMAMAEYDLLFALQGQKVSISTIDIDTRNTFRIYQAILQDVNGTQAGINMVGVSLRFLVIV